MGFIENGNATANIQSAKTLEQLLVEQIETNRLLRVFAGEPEAPWPVSHQPKRSEKVALAKKDRQTKE